MNVLCRFGFHRWQYHGQPPDRRTCTMCLTRYYLVHNEWTTHKPKELR